MVKETYDLEPFSSSSTDPDISIYAISFVPTKRTVGGGGAKKRSSIPPSSFPTTGPRKRRVDGGGEATGACERIF